MTLKTRALLAFGVVVLLAASACGDEGAEFNVDLAGENEVCDDPNACGGDGSGTATVTIDPDQNEVCYEIELEGVEGANAAHIHEGAEGEAGDPVVDLAYTGDDSGVDDCVDEVDEGVLEDILDDPSGYYINVHTEQLPDGAARGQLES
jgi:hypothetical protein